tara:strand:+ start:2719 stop:2919 length:201 start_codon:yes stop_codon:yes gene_type:complete
MDHNIEKLISKPQLEGQVGENAVWSGPLDTSGFPMGSGSSSGITGMQVKKYPCEYKAGPITQRAKQ